LEGTALVFFFDGTRRFRFFWRGAGVSQEKDRTVFELEQAGRTFYCNSAAYVSWLLARGWRLTGFDTQASLHEREASSDVSVEPSNRA
jgi:hypothetical protein